MSAVKHLEHGLEVADAMRYDEIVLTCRYDTIRLPGLAMTYDDDDRRWLGSAMTHDDTDVTTHGDFLMVSVECHTMTRDDDGMR